MPNHRRLAAIVLGVTVSLAARAQTPQAINYQGRLTEGPNLVNGAVHLTLRLYPGAVGGTPVYEDEPPGPVSVVDGLYSTLLGDNTATGSLTEALSLPEVWLETVVNGTPLSPRERIASVAYAAHAWGLSGNAGTVPGVTFLGTTDDRPVELRVNGQRVAQLLSDTNAWGCAPRFVVGPSVNEIGTNSPGATIAGGGVSGHANRIESGANFAFIGAGLGNTIQAGGKSGFIGAGYHNTIEDASDCVLGGGFQNAIQTNSEASVLAGGTGNTIGPAATNAVIGGGFQNRIQSNAIASVVAGGRYNVIESSARFSAVGGGYSNAVQANLTSSVVGGGAWNTIGTGAQFAAIGGGHANSIGPSSIYAVVSGGAVNSASGVSSVVAGGYNNRAGANDSAIGGGVDNLALGFRSVIPGGFANETTGAYSFAAGRRAKARNDGAFVWADSTDADFGSSASNQFLIRAAGGLGVGVTNPAYTADFGGRVRLRQGATSSAGLWLYQNGSAADRAFVGMYNDGYVGLYGSAGASWSLLMNVTNGNVGFGVTNPAFTADFGGRIRVRQEGASNAGLWLYQTVPASDRVYFGMSDDNHVGIFCAPSLTWGLAVDVTNGHVGLGGAAPSASNKVTVSGGAYCSGTTWVNASDRNLKDGFAPADTADILARVAALPISTWHYRSEGEGTRHLGPTAQDFRAAFGLGYDDTSIATVDEGGVALAALQAMSREVQALKQQNGTLQQELDLLRQRLHALDGR